MANYPRDDVTTPTAIDNADTLTRLRCRRGYQPVAFVSTAQTSCYYRVSSNGPFERREKRHCYGFVGGSPAA